MKDRTCIIRMRKTKINSTRILVEEIPAYPELNYAWNWLAIMSNVILVFSLSLSVAQQPKSGVGRLILEVLRFLDDTPTHIRAGLL